MNQEATVHSLWDARVRKAAKSAAEKARKANSKAGKQSKNLKLEAALKKYSSNEGLQNRKKPSKEEE